MARFLIFRTRRSLLFILISHLQNIYTGGMKSLQTRIILLFLLSGLLLFSILFLLIGMMVDRDMTDLAYEKAGLHADKGASLVTARLDRPYFALTELVTLVEALHRAGVDDDLLYGDLVSSLLLKQKSIFSLWLLFEPGTEELPPAVWTFRGTDWSIETELEPWEAGEYEEPYYRLARERKGLVFTEPYMEEVEPGREVLMMSMSYPLYSSGGSFLGVAGCDLELDFLDQLIREVEAAGGGAGTIATESGLIIADSVSSREGAYLSDVHSADTVSAASRAASEGLTIEHETSPAGNGSGELQMISSIEAGGNYTGWIFIASFPLGDIKAPVRSIITGLVLLGAGALLLLALLIVFLARTIARPLKELALRFSDAAAGDLSIRMEVKSRDETGRLAGAFNHLAISLNDALCGLDGMIREVRNRAELLVSGAEKARASFDEMNSSITEMIMKGSDNTRGLEGAGTSVREISESIRVLEERLQDQSNAVLQSSAAVEEMLANIESITSSMVKSASSFEELLTVSGAGEEELTTMIGRIEGINARSEELLETNTVISGIAGQTNLLSMNAAIEAAHAGEAGRGFAVVADEIRKLAENSAAQSRETERILKEIVGEVGAITGASRKTGETFSRMRSLIRQVVDIEGEMKGSMQEQSSSSREIQSALDGLKDVTSDIHEKAGAVAREAETISREVTVLGENSREISNHIIKVHSAGKQVQDIVGDALGQAEENRRAAAEAEEAIRRFTLARESEEPTDEDS